MHAVQPSLYDIVVIGGGINGAGIARDAAGRGYSVLLAEQNDLAAATSSASTKLIHGGLRYLEYYEFRLVREALIEREVLLRAAPHVVWPLRFVLPHHKGLRPRWMLRLGLFLYDHLGGRKILPGCRKLDLRTAPEGRALKDAFVTGFAYSDCWVDDSRLVILNAMDAAERGARIETRAACTGLARDGDRWTVKLTHHDGRMETVCSRAVVNAAGPWVIDLINRAEGVGRKASMRLVKGSHIVVPRIFPGEYAYIFQNADGRVVFAISYEGQFTLIGTTDEAFTGDPAAVTTSDAEVDYLIDLVNQYLAKPLSREDVVWSYSGVRPLYDDRNGNASAVTRDYVFDLDHQGGAPPLLSIFGGKITTYRKLAEHALGKLEPLLGTRMRAWTREASLPGGDIAGADFPAFLAQCQERHPWCPPDLMRRWARAYGTRVHRLIGNARALADLGAEVAPGLYEAEMDYLMDAEWALTADDILWRRSKLGLHLTADQRQAVHDWMTSEERADYGT